MDSERGRLLMKRLSLADVLSRYSVDDSGCWIWTGARSGRRYGGLRYRGRSHRAHRFFYEHMVGPIPQGMYIRHSCHKTLCVNPAHLLPGTQRDNMEDMVCAGRQARGEKIARYKHGELNAASKLSVSQVEEIRRRFAAGERQAHLAKEYGVADSTIFRIRNLIGWVWVSEYGPVEKIRRTGM